MESKKGMAQVWMLVTGAVALVVATVVIAFGAKINSDVSADLSGDAKDVAENGTKAMATFGKNLPLVATIIVVVIIIGLLLAGFAFRGRR